jgi:RNA polymerase sigma factor (sigma-70 family)
MKTGNRINLTVRERVILKFVSKGCTNKEIAEALHISVETVKKHLQNIYRKLQAGNKIEALRKSGIL